MEAPRAEDATAGSGASSHVEAVAAAVAARPQALERCRLQLQEQRQQEDGVPCNGEEASTSGRGLDMSGVRTHLNLERPPFWNCPCVGFQWGRWVRQPRGGTILSNSLAPAVPLS